MDAIGGFLQKKNTEFQGQTITQMLSTIIRHSRHGDINAENRTTTCRIETTREVHGKHLRILQAAIKDYKVENRSQRLDGKALLEFGHPRYSHLQQQYGIPQRLRTGKELTDYSKKDPSVLRQYRCLPINRYYSMLLENTPGYEKNTSGSVDREEAARSRVNELRSDQNKGEQELRSDQNSSIQGLRSDQNIKILIRRGEPSHPPEHKLMQHRILEKDASSSSINDCE